MSCHILCSVSLPFCFFHSLCFSVSLCISLCLSFNEQTHMPFIWITTDDMYTYVCLYAECTQVHMFLVCVCVCVCVCVHVGVCMSVCVCVSASEIIMLSNYFIHLFILVHRFVDMFTFRTVFSDDVMR